MPEWGIMHAHNPQTSDKALSTIYRSVACPPFHGTALAALLTPGAKELWNHDAYFDYTDRYMAFTGPGGGVRRLLAHVEQVHGQHVAHVSPAVRTHLA